MSRNGRIRIACSFVSKGTYINGQGLKIIRVTVTDTQEGKEATVYAGKSEDKERYFELKGNTHGEPFLGRDAAGAAIPKIERRVRNIDPDEVICYLAQL